VRRPETGINKAYPVSFTYLVAVGHFRCARKLVTSSNINFDASPYVAVAAADVPFISKQTSTAKVR
jgi:hypothetical protein